jgi:uncharacterized protein YecT (DUF1311 family)
LTLNEIKSQIHFTIQNPNPPELYKVSRLVRNFEKDGDLQRKSDAQTKPGLVVKKSIVLLLTLLIMPFLIFADSETDFDVSKCYDSAQTNDALKACANEDYALADNKLYQIYTKLTEQIKGNINPDAIDQSDTALETLNRLVISEKAWISYRDAQCNFEGTVMIGGHGEAVVVTGCLSRLTKERAHILEESIIEPKIEY